MSVPATAVAIAPESMKQLLDSPLLALAPEVRVPAYRTWMAYRYLTGMDSPGAIAFPMAVWAGSGDIPSSVLIAALEAVTRPGAARNVKYPSDLIALIADQVHRINQKRFADTVPTYA